MWRVRWIITEAIYHLNTWRLGGGPYARLAFFYALICRDEFGLPAVKPSKIDDSPGTTWNVP